MFSSHYKIKPEAFADLNNVVSAGNAKFSVQQ